MPRLPPPWLINDIERRRRDEERRPFAELPEYPPEAPARMPARESSRVVIIEL